MGLSELDDVISGRTLARSGSRCTFFLCLSCLTFIADASYTAFDRDNVLGVNQLIIGIDVEEV